MVKPLRSDGGHVVNGAVFVDLLVFIVLPLLFEELRRKLSRLRRARVGCLFPLFRVS